MPTAATACYGVRLLPSELPLFVLFITYVFYLIHIQWDNLFTSGKRMYYVCKFCIKKSYQS